MTNILKGKTQEMKDQMAELREMQEEFDMLMEMEEDDDIKNSLHNGKVKEIEDVIEIIKNTLQGLKEDEEVYISVEVIKHGKNKVE